MRFPTLHQVMDIVTYTSFVMSAIYSVLPTVETFNGYPRFQKVYALFLSILKQLGANLRNVVYPQISTQHGTAVSPAGASTTLVTPSKP